MWASYYAGNAYVASALAALVFFLAAFAVVVVKTMWRGDGRTTDALANLPLDDDHPTPTDAQAPGIPARPRSET